MRRIKANSTSNPAALKPEARKNAAPLRERQELIDYIKLKITVAGGKLGDEDITVAGGKLGEEDFRSRLSVPYEVVAHLRERVRLSFGQHSPIDKRTQDFLDRVLGDLSLKAPIRLPGLGEVFILDRVGIAQELSIPENGDMFQSDIVSSYRLINNQGVLHNPKSDRRTTHGVFHVAEVGLPIPDDKKAVPKPVFAAILREALNPPPQLKRLPFTIESGHQVESFVSLMIRPIVVPEVETITCQKTSEIKFMAPGNLISNLDFIERIFGNAGDPYLPENDAGLDIEHWTGHTGYVILAPHLISLTKKSLGLPNKAFATERQKRDGMYWTSADELYNEGEAFKLTARDARGVIITIIADNYFGYCKKEVKTQISFAANLMGQVEEEHSGGAIVYPEYDLGKHFSVPTHLPKLEHTFTHMVELFSSRMTPQPEGYAIDCLYPDVFYVPEDVEIDLDKQTVTWRTADGPQSLPLDPTRLYIVPSGFKVRLEREADSGQWRLIGGRAEGTFCHKPSTVSGGGKSEISKSISDAIMHGPFFIADFERDMDAVEKLLNHDYSHRFRDRVNQESRDIISPKRSLGSVIKLLTRSKTLYSDEYNAWLDTIPHPIRQLVYIVKRLYRQEMGNNWRSHFSVDIVNGRPGNELKYHDEKLVTHYMRVGYMADGKWRMFSLRSDFVPANKLQQEDDITASMVVPSVRLHNMNPQYDGAAAYKFISAENPELRFFQRPDEAIHRGYDKFTEAHFARPNNFLSNFAPLTTEDAKKMLAAPITFGEFTKPMQEVIRKAAREEGYFVSSAHPRIVDGKPTKNPRYLQERPDLIDQKPTYLAETGARLYRQIPLDQPVFTPVNAVLPGRRLNPPDAQAGVRSLAVYNPIHYQETPELFMELISSLTGKSPSTTGAGSEGALTKGPFNALPPIIDVNNALVSHILTSTECFVTAAGYVGPQFRVDHDISLLVPEVWSRMEVAERAPRYLLENNFLEKCNDFDYGGRTILASRLGYRITAHFVRSFFGIIFDNPNDIFTREMLRPETQDLELFVDGIDNIVTTQQRIAEYYFNDGSIDYACPPLRALLHIMKDGDYDGRDVNHPEIRALFTREHLLESDWYQERLAAQQSQDIRLWERHAAYLNEFLSKSGPLDDARREEIAERKNKAQETLEKVMKAEYLEELRGFIGADPSVVRELEKTA